MVGGNLVGGNPVEVRLMKIASLCNNGREDQSGASWPTSVTPWRRCDLTCGFEGQERIEYSKVSGFEPQLGQEVSASGDLQVRWADR